MKAEELFNLTGRVALVTGAGSGLGARFAKILSDNGAKVVLMGRRHAAIEAVANTLSHAHCVAGDVQNRDDIIRAFDEAEKAFGTVDILVNNAGIATAGKAVEITETDYRMMNATNLDSVWFATQICAQRLLANKQTGAIINIASILGFGVQKGVSTYAISKAAVVQLTKAFGAELAHKGIRVNAIAPGYITTDINRDYLASDKGQLMLKAIPAGFYGDPSDLDGALLLLASNASRFMAGATITVDGGHVSLLGS
jgi:NAD(P)-dependent dehydrogenase (short-subunit alcohol dehydrogenase family)